MALINKYEEVASVETHLSDRSSETAIAYAPSYQDQDVELDSIERLKANIFQLSDLERRLAFMNKELESVLGSKKRS